ncbi:hypothetical protein LTR56_010888 [Elasticomyces elasticus]|nr:hypothetical protein LTR56_010888 [Elasticomyces elasticus]KAK3650239.1 hypothetical protein LTR22_012566 [Elasticomyces elasticus]KAK4911830.1 hypothetical protein LTR49_019630 [Elasticomyces elasticus]KAK5768258.1 hypothetical protein LTS12_001397 [Elasticomyces elasticus]
MSSRTVTVHVNGVPIVTVANHFEPNTTSITQELAPNPHPDLKRKQPHVWPAAIIVPKQSKALDDAIANADPDHLRKIVRAICLLSPDGHQIASQSLLDPRSNPKAATARVASPPTGQRSVRAVKQIEAPPAAKANASARAHHTGCEKRVDYNSDIWADHDDRCHGYPEALVNDPDYAWGMKWSCCGRSGDEEVCSGGNARQRVGSSKKARVV